MRTDGRNVASGNTVLCMLIDIKADPACHSQDRPGVSEYRLKQVTKEIEA
jgi:hypothetical protein